MGMKGPMFTSKAGHLFNSQGCHPERSARQNSWRVRQDLWRKESRTQDKLREGSRTGILRRVAPQNDVARHGALRLSDLGRFVILSLAFGLILAGPGSVWAQETANYRKAETGLYRDVFDQNIYYEGTNVLHLDRLYRLVFKRKIASANVNVFDEVPASTFFTNRHARQRLSARQLAQGYRETEGPDLSGDLVITRGKFEGLHPGFFVRDAQGDEYLVKFDSVDNFEAATAAEIITGRFYYALGYNVPQYSIAVFDPAKLVPGPDATIVDDSGFEKKLTRESLEEYLLFVPLDAKGRYRASASKVLQGEIKGSFSFQGRRKNDPDDPVPHKDRREIRALRVFSSWVNNYDVRESNTLDVLVTEDGREILKHYLIDFNASLGAGAEGAKPPMFAHEHMLDYGEAFKAFFSLGWWEKPWQKRWRESGQQVTQSPAVGYFDNRYFDPGKYKTQLPNFAFKDLTRADAFWAAKIIMTFSDEDVRAMVRSGELSDPEDAEEIAAILIERRDIIGRYWFDRASPLDAFDVEGNRLVFKDLAVANGFYPDTGNTYHVDVVGKRGKRGTKVASFDVSSPAVDLEPSWLSDHDGLDIWIRTARSGSEKVSPFVLVQLDRQGITGIRHQD